MKNDGCAKMQLAREGLRTVILGFSNLRVRHG